MSLLKAITKSRFSTFGKCQLPAVTGEPFLHYGPGSPERAKLKDALAKTRTECPEIPCIVNGERIYTGDTFNQFMPSNNKTPVCIVHKGNEETIKKGIESAMNAKHEWESMPMDDRLAIFTKASWLLSTKYRYDINAATMLGQGKTVWQAEIDSAAELIDFFRFGAKFVEELYSTQNLQHEPGVWNKLEYRALEGFVLAISPFNFTAIGGNLPATPAMCGNTVLWKPSSTAILSNYLIYKILEESGLPPGVINFIPSSGKDISNIAVKNKDLGGINFTGSTQVFQNIWSTIGNNIMNYRSYPRIVGETGGKNYHFIHSSADIESAVACTVRGAFEYQGQKCSATSRIYCPKSIWDDVKSKLIELTQKIKIGEPDNFENFMTAVIDENSFDNITKYINIAKNDNNCKILIGGDYDKSKGYYINPTIIETKNIDDILLNDEIFGPVLTCFVYDDDKYIETLKYVNNSSKYALTGSLFALDRKALSIGVNELRNSAGNFYINDKSTGSIVCKQPFGGARQSGTNDKAGYNSIFYRFISIRSIKENFIPQNQFMYPSMEQ